MECVGHKYRSDNFSAKKFIIGQFLDFKMVDLKIVLSQVEEIQVIFNEIVTKEWL